MPSDVSSYLDSEFLVDVFVVDLGHFVLFQAHEIAYPDVDLDILSDELVDIVVQVVVDSWEPVDYGFGVALVVD